MARLSAEDQEYVAEQIAGNHSSSDASPATDDTVTTYPREKLRSFTQLLQSASQMRFATEVLWLYKTFLKNDNLSAPDREAAMKQLPLWEERAKKNMVRLGMRWLPPEEALNQKRQARQLINEALQLIEVGQFQTAAEKCLKASQIDEDGIQSNFLLGLGYALLEHDAKEANKQFSECLKRDPQHNSVLNNLALSEIRLKKYDRALAHWQAALELAPATSEIIQNLGRLLHLSQKGLLHLTPGTETRFGNLYAKASVSAETNRFNDHTGWLYMGYYEPIGSQYANDDTSDRKETSKKTNNKIDSLTTTGWGTGFVVYPEYVLTNRHVVAGSDGILIVPPGETKDKLKASVVAIAEGKDDDLAIIHCRELSAPPLPFIKGSLASRGTEILVLGYPGMPQGNTPSIRSTRGIIAGLPDDNYNAYTLDAIVNFGNSGGPICDSMANVVGTIYAMTTRLNMNYSLGVPHSRAIPLLEKYIPGYQQISSNSEIKQWSEVDAIVSRSIVRILIQKSLYGLRIKTDNPESKGEKPKKVMAVLEDPWCVVCNGRGTADCPNPDCRNGTIGAKRTDIVARNPVSGETYNKIVPIRVPCPTCGGKGIVKCPYCTNGLDNSLK